MNRAERASLVQDAVNQLIYTILSNPSHVNLDAASTCEITEDGQLFDDNNRAEEYCLKLSNVLKDRSQENYRAFIKQISKEVLFLKALLEWLKTFESRLRECDRVEKRLIASAIIHIFSQVMSCDDLKQESLLNNIKLIWAKNQEYELATNDVEDPITFGFELEFHDQFNLYSFLSENRYSLSLKAADRLKSLEQIFGHFNAVTFFSIKELSKHRPLFLNFIYALIEYPELRSTLVRDGSWPEYKSNPAASYKTSIRELLAIYKANGFSFEWAIHMTLSGVELSTEKTDFMVALLVSAAAGNLPTSKFIDFLDQSSAECNEGDFLEMFLDEEFPKRSEKKSKSLIFPFHKSRNADEDAIIPYPKYGHHQQRFIEQRSILYYLEDDSFFDFVRHVSFMWLVAWAIRAVQKSPAERSVADEQMAKSWIKLKRKFFNLLKQLGIQKLAQSDFFKKEGSDSTEYQVLLGNLMLESLQTNSDLNIRVFQAVSEFRSEIIPLIPGLKRSKEENNSD